MCPCPKNGCLEGKFVNFKENFQFTAKNAWSPTKQLHKQALKRPHGPLTWSLILKRCGLLIVPSKPFQ